MNNRSYLLHIVVERSVEIVVGRFGTVHFPRGRYVYCGSGREARIQRHLSKEKKLKWHVDFLLANPHVRVVDVTRSEEPECQLNQSVQGRVVSRGFGSSDCRAGCGSHLKQIGGML